MHNSRHKSKNDGKRHKKIRVARFITNRFYYWNANPTIEAPIINDNVPPKITRKRSASKEVSPPLTPPPEELESDEIISDIFIENESNSEQVLQIDTISRPFPPCIAECIPKDFDIIRRGPLPSIVFHNQKIQLIS